MGSAKLINPLSTRLQIGYKGIIPSDQDEWKALGERIGSHKRLRELTFWFWGIDPTHENLEALLVGVGQNRTVKNLHFYFCDGEWPPGILAIFLQNNQNLHLLEVNSCGHGAISSLSAALRGCPSCSLEYISCDDIQMGAEEFFEALAVLPQLKGLELDGCNIGRRGCGALAALLQRPECMLQNIHFCLCSIGNEDLAVLESAVATSSTLTELTLQNMSFSTAALQSFAGVLRRPACMLKILDLSGNRIGDDEMISFADALTTNRTLEKLCFREHTVSDIGFTAMTRALCNTSSIDDVHRSNHTLQDLDYLPGMPNDLRNYLRMNKREDKSQVTREKIFMHFFKGNFSMEPFHEINMPPIILPHLLGWIGRTPDEKSFTALFSFLRRMPPTLGNRRSVLRRSRRKRKVRN